MSPKDETSRFQARSLSAAGRLERLFPAVGESSVLTVACRRPNYSASAIARAVEDCDAHLLNLNVTSDVSSPTDPLDDTLVAELRITHRDPSAVTRSLERYGFRVLEARGRDSADDEALRLRLDELIHYLNV